MKDQNGREVECYLTLVEYKIGGGNKAYEIRVGGEMPNIVDGVTALMSHICKEYIKKENIVDFLRDFTMNTLDNLRHQIQVTDAKDLQEIIDRYAEEEE